MKKTIIILLVVCLLGGAAAGYLLGRGENGDAVKKPTESLVTEGEVALPETEPEAVTEAEEYQAPEVQLLDYEKLYRSHAADEAVAEVDGREVPWAEYCYQLMSQASRAENYFMQMATYYGQSASWTDQPEEDDPATFADIAVENAEDVLVQVRAIEGFAAANGVELNEEDAAAIQEQLESDIAAACGEGATEEDFNAYLDSIYLSREVYDRMNVISMLYQEGYLQLYGEGGEKLSDEAAMSYLTEHGYMAATHILLMTIDPTTGEALDEAAVAEKKAVAEKLAAELQAIEDPEERLARFKELKEEYCEDTGKAAYPDGYVFTPGTMVTEFEDAVLAQEEYQVSDPVESTYGYHIIMTLPLNPDATIEYSSGGAPLSARSKAANEEYGQRVQDYYDGLSLTLAPDFERPDLTAFIAE